MVFRNTNTYFSNTFLCGTTIFLHNGFLLDAQQFTKSKVFFPDGMTQIKHII